MSDSGTPRPEFSGTLTSLPVLPRELDVLEGAAIAKRRLAAGLGDEQGPRVGLALSGGGIRSATFSLGVMQALAKHRLLRRFDYLSTVSGGGYAGAFLGRLFTRPDEELARALPKIVQPTPGQKLSTVDLVERILTEPRSKPLSFLRENGRYLSPNGAGDLLLAGAVALRNTVSIHIVLATLVLTLFLAAHGARVLLRLAGAFPFPPAAAGILWSDWLALPALVFLFLAVPIGWAYWLGQGGASGAPWYRRPVFGGWFVLAAALALVGVSWTSPAVVPSRFIPPLGSLALIASVALFFSRTGKAADDLARNNRLSRQLKGALIAALATFAFAVLDTFGATLYGSLAQNHFDVARTFGLWKSALSASAIGALVAFGRKLATFLSTRTAGKRLSLPAAALAWLASLALVLVLLTGFSALSYGVASGFGMLSPSPGAGAVYAWVFPFGIALTLLFGRTLPFLNQSSLQAIYGARLARAYLGASNPERWRGRGENVTEPLPGDGLNLDDYRPDMAGGPLHLVNVTLNETVAGKSQVEQRDRKGLAMAVGPLAFSAGKRSHALRVVDPWRRLALRPLEASRSEYAIFTPPSGDLLFAEPLPLETWVSISGAAFSTGLGSRTSFGLSLLCGVFNVRLGYWWDSGIDPEARAGRTMPTWAGRAHLLLDRLLPVQVHLFDEFLARFPGPNSRRWYLSDGGHFENTACYELIRRRVPVIVLCDDGADPEYQFGDLANLVRKARVDFRTEITFLEEADLADEPEGRFFGSLDELRRDGPDGFAKKHAALARIRYPDGGGDGVLIVLKPTLAGNEPLDLLEYQAGHKAFPQEPTSDQFFDEAQWESYRRLGEVVGTRFCEALGRRPLAPETLLGRPNSPPRAS
jgi:hypothetical protein